MALAKKQFSAQFQSASLDVPPAIDQVAPEALVAAVATLAPIIVDVRQPEEFQRGHIAGARNVPFDGDDFDHQCKALAMEAAASSAAGRPASVVFVSFQSPDLDVNAALHFEAVRSDLEGAAAAGASVSHTLLGGMSLWLQRHRHDSTLTNSYDAGYWEETLTKLSPLDRP